MPYLVLGRLEDKDGFQGLEIPYDIENKYPSILKLAEKVRVRVRTYVVRAYNEKGDIVKELKRMETLNVHYNVYKYLDLSHLHHHEGIPIGYFVEIIMVNFVIPSSRGMYETPIFPNEFKKYIHSSAPEKAERRISDEIRALKKIGEDIEVIGLLYKVNL